VNVIYSVVILVHILGELQFDTSLKVLVFSLNYMWREREVLNFSIRALISILLQYNVYFSVHCE